MLLHTAHASDRIDVLIGCGLLPPPAASPTHTSVTVLPHRPTALPSSARLLHLAPNLVVAYTFGAALSVCLRALDVLFQPGHPLATQSFLGVAVVVRLCDGLMFSL